MRRLMAFESLSLDGYFAGAKGDLSWAHKEDAEWRAFVGGNASGGGGTLLFGRVTYELMVSYWPTPEATDAEPEVAGGMNDLPKVVFSRSLESVAWRNTRLVKEDLAGSVRAMKSEPGEDMVILGSGSIVSQLAREGLIDAYQIVVNPIVLGEGRPLWSGLRQRLPLRLTQTRAFGNGNVVLSYEPVT